MVLNEKGMAEHYLLGSTGKKVRAELGRVRELLVENHPGTLSIPSKAELSQ